jgi:hypothetical protein
MEKYMSNKLEKFINNNRSDFDSDQPDAELWNKIESTLPAKKQPGRFSIRHIYKWAAAAALTSIILTSVYFLYIRKKEKVNITAETTKPAQSINNNELAGIAPEYAAEVNRFYRTIETRQKELKNATTDRPELYLEFLSDLKVLDSTYTILQKQAAQTPNRDVIMKAMLQNLQLQAELLYRQLTITNEIKESKNQKNEKAI